MRAMLIVHLIASSGTFVMGSPAYAQWQASVEIGASRFWGASRELSGQHRSFRPYRPTTLGASLERRGQRLAAGVYLNYSKSSLALEGTDAVVAVRGVFQTFSISPQMGYRLTYLRGDNQLRLQVGPLIELWTIVDEGSRIRAGAQGALSLDVPLGGRFGGSVLAGIAVVPSPFNSDELDVGYERLALWRRRFGVAFAYRL
jgi:hypothetical protein